MTLPVRAKMLLHVSLYDFYDTTLSIEKQRRHMIEFIKSAHLKYGIYKPREAEHPIKKRVRLHSKDTHFSSNCYRHFKIFISAFPPSLTSCILNFVGRQLA